MNEYSKYLPLKSAIEDLFGSKAWYDLKESNHLPTWKKYADKTLDAIVIAIKDSVAFYDDDWLAQIESEVKRGHESIRLAKSIDDVIGCMSGALIQISFRQIGEMPKRTGSRKKVQLRKGQWNLGAYRSVYYLQSKEQKESLFRDRLIRELGLDKHQELAWEYRKSGSSLPFSEWYERREDA